MHSIVTADPQIREEDFEVDPEDVSHKPQDANKEPEISPVREGIRAVGEPK